MRLQLITVETEMSGWMQTGFIEYLRHFLKNISFELIEVPAGKRDKSAGVKCILDKEGE